MRHIIPILFILFSFNFSFAQVLNGVIQTESGDKIVAAYVLNVNTDEHSHTDENGGFELKDVTVGDSIYISHIGYDSRYFVANDLSSTMMIKLKEANIILDEVTIAPSINALNVFTAIDVRTNPVVNSQEVLQSVPGLFIGQHAGGGKAEQIFLRGFDIDHGTDINITVDGLPVNMVSHAHGQGYADMHFLIPETLEGIDFGKGPYATNQGNFSTAGYVSFRTKDRLNGSQIGLEIGQFNTQRITGLFDVINTENHSAYIASSYMLSDGPFESSQNFNRTNLMAKYTGQVNPTNRISVLASRFTSTWDASGQIPTRSVEDGSITRFGAIDDTEGGNTSRTNLLIQHTKNLGNDAYLNSSAFYSQYDFELYSNFTFFLEDPVNGDQIKQREVRDIFGLNTEYSKSDSWLGAQSLFQIGGSVRQDISLDNELSRTKNRSELLSRVAFGDIYESNLAAYSSLNLDYDKWIINAGLRLDHFRFTYHDRLTTLYDNESTNQTILSPKLNFLYNQSEELQLFAKFGKSFHSNDARVVLAETEEQTLPAAYGTDLGLIWKPRPDLIINTSYWYLFLEQEFVYVGDAGIVEPSGQTRRYGVDLSMRYQPLQWLYWSFDANYNIARAIDEPETADFIPLAPDLTIASRLNVQHESGIYGGVEVRYLDDRPANEDGSIVAIGYTVVDANVGYSWNQFNFGIFIQNVLDTDWNETQFATESRLFNEPTSVEEIHYTPGTPFNARASLTYSF